MPSIRRGERERAESWVILRTFSKDTIRPYSPPLAPPQATLPPPPPPPAPPPPPPPPPSPPPPPPPGGSDHDKAAARFPVCSVLPPGIFSPKVSRRLPPALAEQPPPTLVRAASSPPRPTRRTQPPRDPAAPGQADSAARQGAPKSPRRESA